MAPVPDTTVDPQHAVTLSRAPDGCVLHNQYSTASASSFKIQIAEWTPVPGTTLEPDRAVTPSRGPDGRVPQNNTAQPVHLLSTSQIAT